MKNTGKKIIILGVATAIAVSCIFAFYPTIVAPPKDVPVRNLHKLSLENNIAGFSDKKNFFINDSLYNVVIDKLVLYKAESFMTEDEIDDQTGAFVQKYLPIFIGFCNAKFASPVWNESEHNAILDRIAQLRTLKIDNGETMAITAVHDSELSRIEEVIYYYRDAKKIAAYSTFYSVKDANSKIQKAEKYIGMEPLSNCRDLVVELSSVKSRIGNSHYQSVLSKVKEMADYNKMTEESFNSLMVAVNNKIQEYDNNLSMYGSRVKSAEDLRMMANEYYREAKAYYTRLKETKEIKINTNYQWVSMPSPNTGYRAYKSNSNYHKPNSEAVMSFSIKGYRSFTFYIRSYGEAHFDYVMVGVDKLPTTMSNYSNTQGYSSPGTSMSYYKTVTLNNLSESLTYTVYVVYCKDGYNNVGTDRGYVLIPYANN